MRARSDCAGVRPQWRVQLQQRPKRQQQRRYTYCLVYLDDDALTEASGGQSRPPASNGRSSYTSSAEDPLIVKGALTDAQLQAAITQVLGPQGYASEGNEEAEEDDRNDEIASTSYSNVWGNCAAHQGMLPYQELGSSIDGPISEEAGRADVQALQAMHTRVQKSKLSNAQSDTGSVVTDTSPEEGEVQTAERVVLLPAIVKSNAKVQCKPHRNSNDTSAFLTAMTDSSKFLDRWVVFTKQLDTWGYHEVNTQAFKRTMTNFARSNPDLLYMLPVRQLHIFVKKFRAFPSRSLDRKFRAAAARLGNLYVDFQIEATFNGNASFQDLARLLLFVAASDFGEIEDTSPGIVAAASELLVEILVASTQPPSKLARADHSEQWRDTRDSFSESASTNGRSALRADKKGIKTRPRSERRKQKQSSKLHSEEAERRIESEEEKLAARLRTGSGRQAGSQRTAFTPWTPWDDVPQDSGYGSGRVAQPSRHMRARDSNGTAESISSGDSSRRNRGEVETDVWGADGGTKPRKTAGSAGSERAKHSQAASPAQQQKQSWGSDSRMDFMNLVGDGAVGGARSNQQTCRNGGDEKASRRDGYGSSHSGASGGGGYSGGAGLL